MAAVAAAGAAGVVEAGRGVKAPEDLPLSSRPGKTRDGSGSRDSGINPGSAMRRANLWISLVYGGLVLFLLWKFVL